jgi:hypothetical protein
MKQQIYKFYAIIMNKIYVETVKIVIFLMILHSRCKSPCSIQIIQMNNNLNNLKKIRLQTPTIKIIMRIINNK